MCVCTYTCMYACMLSSFYAVNFLLVAVTATALTSCCMACQHAMACHANTSTMPTPIESGQRLCGSQHTLSKAAHRNG